MEENKHEPVLTWQTHDEIHDLIKQKRIVGPIKVKAYVDIEGGAVEYFKLLSKEEKMQKAEILCSAHIERRSTRKADRCFKKLSGLIKKFDKELSYIKICFGKELNIKKSWRKTLKKLVSFEGDINFDKDKTGDNQQN